MNSRSTIAPLTAVFDPSVAAERGFVFKAITNNIGEIKYTSLVNGDSVPEGVDSVWKGSSAEIGDYGRELIA